MKQIFILLSLILFSIISFGQQTGKKYQNTLITLSSGKVIKANRVTITEDSISFPKYITKNSEVISYDLNTVSNIIAPAGNNAFPGFLIGTGIGTLFMLIYEKEYEKTEKITHTCYAGTNLYELVNNVPVPVSSYTVELESDPKTLGFNKKMLIIGTGSILGALVGLSIKKGWGTVFTKNTSMINRLDLNLMLCSKQYQNNFRINYRF